MDVTDQKLNAFDLRYNLTKIDDIHSGLDTLQAMDRLKKLNVNKTQNQMESICHFGSHLECKNLRVSVMSRNAMLFEKFPMNIYTK